MKKHIKKEKIVSLTMLGILLITLLVLYAVFSEKINTSLKENFSGSFPLLLQGLGITMAITIISFILGILLGTITCIVEKIDSKKIPVLVLKNIFKAYVSIFRGTPMVIQLLVIYFVVFASYQGDPILVAIFCFGLNSGAYVSEIIRGGINAVPKGQTEAGRSLGLSYSKVMTKIVLPQAIRNSLPSLGNEFITLFKDTSIVGFISIVDLSLAFRKIANATFDYNTVYLVMGVIYFIFVMLFTYLFSLIEKEAFKHVRTK